MIEAGANEVADDTMFEAIMKAHEEIKALCAFIDSIVAEIGKPKFAYPSCELDHDMFDKIFDFCEKDVMFALDTDDKTVRDARMVPIKDAILAEFSENYALTTEGFVFYTQPFQLNNKNANRYTIPVSLNPYRGMLDLK